MSSDIKSSFLQQLNSKFGKLEKFGDSLSLFRISGSNIQIYIRYSKTHPNGKTWYGFVKKTFIYLKDIHRFYVFYGTTKQNHC